tara:strand:+ start:905 stop:3304 length:2400 start_codon:yes stop_codon:yes gene_type:complete
MAERYKQQTQYAPQIGVTSQFGQEKVSRALDRAYKVQSEAGQVLAEGLRKGAQGIDIFRAQKEIEDFSIEYEDVTLEKPNGENYTFKKPKPINVPTFLFTESKQKYDKFALAKIKKEVGSFFDDQLDAVYKRVRFEKGSDPNEFALQIEPIIEATQKSFPNEYKALLEDDINNIANKYKQQTEANFLNIQEQGRNEEYKAYTKSTQEQIESALIAGKINVAKTILEQDFANEALEFEDISSYARIHYKNDLNNMQNLVKFFETYGDFMNPLSVANQQVVNQKKFAKNLEAFELLINGVGDAKLYSPEHQQGGFDTTITLADFQKSMGTLTGQNKTFLNNVVKKRLSIMKDAIDNDDSNNQISLGIEAIKNGEEVITNFRAKQLMDKLDSQKLTERIASADGLRESLGLPTTGQEFDINNPDDYKMLFATKYIPSGVKTMLNDKIWSGDVEWLQGYLEDASKYQNYMVDLMPADIGSSTYSYLRNINNLRLGGQLTLQNLKTKNEYEVFQEEITRDNEKLTLIKDRVDQGIKAAVQDLDVDTNVFGVELPGATFFSKSSQYKFNKLIRDTLLQNNIGVTLRKDEIQKQAEKLLTSYAKQGIYGLTKFGATGSEGLKNQESLGMYPIENFAILNPETMEKDSSYLKSYMYNVYRDNWNEDRANMYGGEKRPLTYDEAEFIVVPAVRGIETLPTSNPLTMKYFLHIRDEEGLVDPVMDETGRSQVILDPFNDIYGKHLQYEISDYEKQLLIKGTGERIAAIVEDEGTIDSVQAIYDQLGFTNDLPEYIKFYNNILYKYRNKK